MMLSPKIRVMGSVPMQAGSKEPWPRDFVTINGIRK
jgi:hypothetical protein